MPPIRRSAYLLAAIALIAFAASRAWKPTPPRAFVGITTRDIPWRIGDWNAAGDNVVAPDVRAALSSADIVSRTYRPVADDALPTLDLVVIGGTDRSALHDPRSCLIGAGWQLDNDRIERLPGTDVAARTCEAIGQPNAPGYDIVYLYVVDGRIENQVTEIRAEMLVSALLGRQNRPVYFIRALVPIDPDPRRRAENHRHLLDFAAAAWHDLAPRIAPHIASPIALPH